jgi:hypothetical protein
VSAFTGKQESIETAEATAFLNKPLSTKSAVKQIFKYSILNYLARLINVASQEFVSVYFL